MFFGSLEAGTNHVWIYTLLANCRVQDLDPEDYLTEVIRRPAPRCTGTGHAGNYLKPAARPQANPIIGGTDLGRLPKNCSPIILKRKMGAFI